MPDFSVLPRAAVALLVAGTLLLTGAPAAVADPVPQSASQPRAARPAPVDLHGDASAHRSARSAGAWKLSTMYYYETIPSKWDWSLATAVAKWNGTGAKIKLVRTTDKRRARVFISYGNTGSAAGMATVGATPGAWVRLNTKYNSIDAVDPWRRVEVMALFAHEIGHVLGFGHTSAPCSLMRPVLDISACYMAPDSMPGYHKCRTIDPALVVTFVRAYGGSAKYPGTWCLIDPLPSQLSGVAFTGGTTSAVEVRWTKPTYLPSGSRTEIRVWRGSTCGVVPAWAESYAASPTALKWQDIAAGRDGSTCYRVNLVNRYGAGRTAVSRLLTGW